MHDQEERSIVVDQTIYSAAAIRLLLAERLRIEQQLEDAQHQAETMRAVLAQIARSALTAMEVING